VRELINFFEAVYVNPPPRKIDVSDLSQRFRSSLQKGDATANDERHTIVSVLIATNWKKAGADTS